MARTSSDGEAVEEREGVALTNLDADLFDGAGVAKRALVDWLDLVADRMLPGLVGRALSVIRVRGSEAFMQKNLPKHAPPWIPRIDTYAETSKRTVTYAVCDDRRTLLWFANQRAVEYHPALVLGDGSDGAGELVIDLDPPEGSGAFGRAVEVAHLVHRVLDDVGLGAAVKTSGAKGVHIVVPVEAGTGWDHAAAATRAIAARTEALDPAAATTAFVKEERGDRVFVDATRLGSATLVAAYSPRVRPGAPVSWPVTWDELDVVVPGDVTLVTAPGLLEGRASWSDLLPAPQAVPEVLVEEGRSIEPGRVAAMHEGRRRKAQDRRAGGG